MQRRCGHCYNVGHNRRSCPEIKKIIRDNPDGYQARIERQRKEQASRNPRRCSYCEETGHNKKTCSKLKHDRIDVAKQSRLWRWDFLACARQHGLTLGTLLKFTAHLDDSKNEWRTDRLKRQVEQYGLFGVVVGFDERMLDKRQKERSYQSLLVRFPNGKTIKQYLPKEFIHLMEQYTEPEMVIAGKVDASKINELFDRQWHDGTDTADFHCGQGN